MTDRTYYYQYIFQNHECVLEEEKYYLDVHRQFKNKDKMSEKINLEAIREVEEG